jgi:hypothetical protein
MFIRSLSLAFALHICLSEASTRNPFQQNHLLVVPSHSFHTFRVLSTIRGGGGGGRRNSYEDEKVPGAARGYIRKRVGTEQMSAGQIPSNEPTITTISNTVLQSFVSFGADSAKKSSAPSSALKEGNPTMLPSAFLGIKSSMVNTFIAHPSLKYILAAVVVFAIIAIVKAIVLEESKSLVVETEPEEPNSTIIIEASQEHAPVDPISTSLEQTKPRVITASITHISKPREETQQFISFQPTRPQVIISLVIGGLGMIAGTIALVAETAEMGLASHRPTINSEKSLSMSVEGQDSCIHRRSCDDAKKVGAGAVGGVLASGMLGRAVIIGKVLSFLF